MRDTHARRSFLAAPGGDAAEFMLALRVYHMNGGTYGKTASEVKVLLEKVCVCVCVCVCCHTARLTVRAQYLNTLPVQRQFYMHTDEHAIENLVLTMGLAGTRAPRRRAHSSAC